MTQDLYDRFLDKINEYKSKVESSKEEVTDSIDSIVAWVENNKEALECEYIDDIFDEYLDMIYYRDEGYKDDMYPNGDDDDMDDILINDDDNEERNIIEDIREYCCEDEDYGFEDEDDFERCLFEDDDEDDNTESPEIEDILDYINRDALVAMGMLEDVDDPEYNNMLEKNYFFHILVGLNTNDSDELIAIKAFNQIVISGYMVEKETLVQLVKEARVKCKKHAFVLQLAHSWLYQMEQDPFEVKMEVMQMLHR